MKYEKLGQHILQVRGISYNPENIRTEQLDGYVPIIKSNNITEEGFDSKELIYISHRYIRPEQFIQKGDIVLTASSGSKKTIGKNIQFDNDYNGSFGAFCKLIRPRSSINHQFLYHFFKTRFFRRSIEQAVQGANISNLKNEYIDDMKIPLPSIVDQIRIAKVLTRTETLIAKRKESIRLVDEFLQSTFFEMFGDPVRNEKGWDKKQLRFFGQIITGNTPSRSVSDNYSSQFIEWIKTDNIDASKTYLTVATEYLSKNGLAKARVVKPGALLVACIAGSAESIGRAAITNRNVSFNQQINAIQPNGGVNSLFLYWLFKIAKLYIQSHATKGMKKILTKGDFEKITMIVPPRSLQNQFAAIVEKVEVIKTKYTESLTVMENLYASLSQRAFKGELDLSKVPVEKSCPHEVVVQLDPVKFSMQPLGPIEVTVSKKFSLDVLRNLTQATDGKPFSFDELWSKIENAAFDELPQYEAVKQTVFKMLSGKNPQLVQVFDKEKKMMVLRQKK